MWGWGGGGGGEQLSCKYPSVEVHKKEHTLKEDVLF